MPTALAVCSQAAAEGGAPHSSKALLEPSDLSVRAYLTPLQQPRDPVSPAAGPQSKTAQCVPHPLFATASFISRALSPRRPHAADTVYMLHYRHRYPVHGTGYASLFLNPCASVYTQLGQAAVRLPAFHCRLSLHTKRLRDEKVLKPALQLILG